MSKSGNKKSTETSFNQSYTELLQKKDLLIALDAYTKGLIKEKKGGLSITDIDVDHMVLDTETLDIKEKIYTIKDPLAIAYSLYLKFQQKFDFKISKDFESSFSFMCKVESEIETYHQRSLLSTVKKQLWNIIIFQSYKEFNEDFHKFIKNRNTENIELNAFCEAYGGLLPELNIDIDIFKVSMDHLETLNNPEKGLYIFLTPIYQGIKKKCLIDNDFGIKLFEKITKEKVDDCHTIMILTPVLYDSIGYGFYEKHLDPLLALKKHTHNIFGGLTNIDNITKKEAQLFLQIYDHYKSDTPLLPHILLLLFTIINADSFPGKKSYVESCFTRINENINREDGSRTILASLSRLDVMYLSQIKNLLTGIISQPYFDLENYSHFIQQLFWHHKSVGLHKCFLKATATATPFKKFPKALKSIVQDVDLKEFDKMLVRLLTDDKAAFRFIAQDIVEHLSLQTAYSFSCDLLDFPPLTQYKLWVSLTERYREPHSVIPTLLPLLQSSSETVRGSLIWKLEEYTEHYGGHLIEVLEKHLDTTDSEHQQILSRIQSYMEDYYKENIDIKHGIKEFDPWETHPELLRSFNQTFGKNFSEMLHEGFDKNSFLGAFTGGSKTKLAKGGGWKLSGRKEITPLGNYGSNLICSRFYLIDPNKWDFEMADISRTDWKKKDFKAIKTLIKNES